MKHIWFSKVSLQPIFLLSIRNTIKIKVHDLIARCILWNALIVLPFEYWTKYVTNTLEEFRMCVQITFKSALVLCVCACVRVMYKYVVIQSVHYTCYCCKQLLLLCFSLWVLVLQFCIGHMFIIFFLNFYTKLSTQVGFTSIKMNKNDSPQRPVFSYLYRSLSFCTKA